MNASTRVLLATLAIAFILLGGCGPSFDTSELELVNPIDGITPKDSGGSEAILRIALSSDPHWGAGSSRPYSRDCILRSVAAESPAVDAFFILGDNTQDGDVETQWKTEAAHLAAYLGSVPARPILGNHDDSGSGLAYFAEYFFPAGFSSDTGGFRYYSIDAGPAVIVVLDLFSSSANFTEEEKAWLEDVLDEAVSEGKRAIVLTHSYFVSSGFLDSDGYEWYDKEDMIANVSPTLESKSVDLVVSGHNHFMEHLYLKSGSDALSGVSYAIVGAMGGYPDPAPTHDSVADSLWFERAIYGYLVLEISASGIELAFKDQLGNLLYSTTLE